MRPFIVQRLDQTGIFCGSYPDRAEHMDKLVEKGISAVLCLQTHEDFQNTS